MSDGKREYDLVKQYWTLVVKQELSVWRKLSVYRLVYIPVLTYEHE